MDAPTHKATPVLAEAVLRSRYAEHTLLGPLVISYVQDLPAVGSELAAAYALGAQAELARLSHRLSGDAATYGFDELAQAAKGVEQAALPGPSQAADWAKVAEAYVILTAVLRRVAV